MERMVHRLMALMCLGGLLFFGVGCQKCVKFDSIPESTRWGTPAGHSPGDVVHTEDGITVTVENRGNSFGDATIRPAFPNMGNAANTRNISLKFDFSALSFTPQTVKFKFMDTGGSENIAVNGGARFFGELASGSSGNVSWEVMDQPQENNPHNRIGDVRMTGPVQNLTLGGQEFWVDSVCAEKR